MSFRVSFVFRAVVLARRRAQRVVHLLLYIIEVTERQRRASLTEDIKLCGAFAFVGFGLHRIYFRVQVDVERQREV